MADTPSDLTARRGYHHGNLREALIEAARRLTAERGPHGFTMADAARAAGVSAAAPYRHFKDREALLAELARRGFAHFGARLRGAGGLDGMGAAYLAFAREEPGYYAAMFDWQGEATAAPAAGGSFDTLIAALTKALATRQKSPDPDRARLLGLQIWALSHGLAGLERAGMPPPGSGVPPPETVLADAVTRLLENG